ncbi:MAG: ribosome biosis GTP-binding protein YsxC [Pseudomonadota bacterium]
MSSLVQTRSPNAPSPPSAEADWLSRRLSAIEFLKSAARVDQLPSPSAPEFAIAGRSNAGKSTTLNVLCQRRRLAFASKTPGRTRLINLFGLFDKEEEVGRLVDLPGYGYAAVSKVMQKQWQLELSRYLATRTNLMGLILVCDCRHPLGLLDTQLLDWFGPRRRPVHVLLTKADKLGRQQQAQTLRAVNARIQDNGPQWGGLVSASLFSGLKQTGRDELLETLADWLGQIREEKRET